MTSPNALTEFQGMGKIARLSRECIVTEKIDGTNAQVVVAENGLTCRAASKNRWITPEDDNYGFAAWVRDNHDALLGLGPGRHFGEWWGRGINRNYGQTERYFSLFAVHRWDPAFGKFVNRDPNKELPEYRPVPDCCRVVPVLYRGIFRTPEIENVINYLRLRGSEVAPGFMKPEGIVIYHSASKTLFKKTIENDNQAKGQN